MKSDARQARSKHFSRLSISFAGSRVYSASTDGSPSHLWELSRQEPWRKPSAQRDVCKDLPQRRKESQVKKRLFFPCLLFGKKFFLIRFDDLFHIGPHCLREALYLSNKDQRSPPVQIEIDEVQYIFSRFFHLCLSSGDMRYQPRG